jgi:hypothetical protein
MTTMTQQDADRRPAATYLAQRILERLDQQDPLAVALRDALADPDGARLDRLDAQDEREKERFFTLLRPLLDADPAPKDAYYGGNPPPDLKDAPHHAALLRRGHDALDLLERVDALPPSDVEIERQGQRAARVLAGLGGDLAYHLLERLPELAGHHRDAEAAIHDLYRAGLNGRGADAATAAYVDVDRHLKTFRGAIARETAQAVLDSLDGCLNLDALVQIGEQGL